MLLDYGVGAPRKCLEACMGEEVWLAELPRAYLATMFHVVVLLFGQHEDQLRSGLPWMKSTSSQWIRTNERVPNACVEGLVYGLEV